MAQTGFRILLISLGNPAPYADTLHSGGHHALAALRRALGLPPFSPERRGGRSAVATSSSGRYTLIQSPTLMNVSGKWVARAWTEFAESEKTGAGLLVLHDDLEQRLGDTKVVNWERSAQGHNGMKSINQHLKRSMFPDKDRWHWARLAVGIGRPVSREPDDVADYVLRSMTPQEQEILSPINASFQTRLFNTLHKVEAQWANGEPGGYVKQSKRKK